MHYIDCYKDIYLYRRSKFFERCGLIKNINKLIKHEESHVDSLLYWMKDFDKQKKIWGKDNYDRFRNIIDTYNLIIRIYNLSGRLSMINLDVYVAMKYMVCAKSDFECRFFARRIFTIIYETRNGYLGDLGNLISELKDLEFIQNIEKYKNLHKRMSRYISVNEKILKETRNTNEAHKDKDFEKQVDSIENFRIEKAFEIIMGFYSLLVECSDLNVLLTQELGMYVNHIFNDMIMKRKSQLI